MASIPYFLGLSIVRCKSCTLNSNLLFFCLSLQRSLKLGTHGGASYVSRSRLMRSSLAVTPSWATVRTQPSGERIPASACLSDIQTFKPSSCFFLALWSSGRHLALGSGGPGFESWLCQVDVESLGKAIYMHFPTPLMCKTSTRLSAVS